MKVLLLNGSPRVDGSTKRGLMEIEKVLNAEGIETEIIEIGSKQISGCRACLACRKIGKCVINDLVNEVNEKFKEADGLVIGSPVYYSSPNGTLISFLDRMFYSKGFDTSMKVGASIAVARRAGTISSLDVLNKYFTISNMVVTPSQYWNEIHGASKEDVEKDLEGLQTMRQLAKNMAFLIKSIDLGRKALESPKLDEKREWTNFIPR